MKKPKHRPNTKAALKAEYKQLDKDCLALWAKCCIARDRTCRYTNEDTFLSVHHIRSASHKATRYDLENGLTLSWRKVHFLQRVKPEKFQDCVIEIIGNKYYERMKRKSLVEVEYTVEDLREIKEYLTKKLAQIKSE